MNRDIGMFILFSICMMKWQRFLCSTSIVIHTRLKYLSERFPEYNGKNNNRKKTKNSRSYLLRLFRDNVKP